MRRRPVVPVALAAAALLAACPSPSTNDDAGVVQDAGVDAGPTAPDGVDVLDEVEDVATMAGARGAVKYLLPVDGAPPQAPLGASCAFQNTARYPYHLQYLRALLGGTEVTLDQYVAWVLRRETRVWWGGEVEWRPREPHPLTGEDGVLVYTLYTEDSPGNRLIIDDVRAVHTILTKCAPAFVGALAFAPSSNEQRATALEIREALAVEDIAVLTGL